MAAPERTPLSHRQRGRLDLLDPASLSQLGGMEWVARQVVEGFPTCPQRSPHLVSSAEDLSGLRRRIEVFNQRTNFRHADLIQRRIDLGRAPFPENLAGAYRKAHIVP